MGDATPTPPSRRLRHRIPVRIRHHWRLLAGTAVFLAVTGLVLTSWRITPIVTSAASETDVITENIEGTVDLFDTTVEHEIAVEYDESDYRTLLDKFFDDGEKDWIHADVTIDGTLIEDVGIRLKGNSTLQGLTRDGETVDRDGGGGGGGGMPGGGEPPEGFEPPDGVLPGGQGPTDDEAGGRMPMGPGGGSGLDSSRPEELPWLIDFGKFDDGRGYQGRSQVTLRVGSMGSGSTLNEAVALDLVAASGEPSQQRAYTTFSVNGGESVARLMVDHLDAQYGEDLGNGVLYKALASGSFAYQGEDISDYSDDFKQINKVGSLDMEPVIAFLKWLDGADDAEFAAHLADHLDVASFANYVALQNLLLNFDDMAGPGNNFYLWYDLDTERLTVVTWDLNLALNGSADQGPYDSGGMGGFMGPTQPAEDGTDPPAPDEGDGEPPADGGFPGGGQPPTDQDGATDDEQQATPGQDDGQGGFPGGMGGNVLKERFLELDAFHEVYETAYRTLYDSLYADGTALDLLDAATAQAVAVGDDRAEEQSATLRELIEQRTEALAADAVITGG